ncbi:hypothetical protein [Bacillus sp. FJAT-27245]|uniref:hypothetical protein n=1 Tax=Bacillus sp. FJAT-27245 TaxID=1684144 RepID=UPI0006A7B243|nr:hypothetical protein [Bacillus sp. FJAT-27245]
MELKRRVTFHIVFMLSVIIGLVCTSLDELWVKKLIVIFLTLAVFSFSDTAWQIFTHVKEELHG